MTSLLSAGEVRRLGLTRELCDELENRTFEVLEELDGFVAGRLSEAAHVAHSALTNLLAVLEVHLKDERAKVALDRPRQPA